MNLHASKTLTDPGKYKNTFKTPREITSSLGLDSTSKLSSKFVGKIKSFRFFLGHKDATKKCDAMGASPEQSKGPFLNGTDREQWREQEEDRRLHKKNGSDASGRTDDVADNNVIHTLEHLEKKLTQASEKPGKGEGRAEQEHQAQWWRARGRGADAGVLPAQGRGGDTDSWAPTQPWRVSCGSFQVPQATLSKHVGEMLTSTLGSVNSELTCFSKSVNSAALLLTANVSYFH